VSTKTAPPQHDDLKEIDPNNIKNIEVVKEDAVELPRIVDSKIS
jgi:hypothetical protein